MNNIGIRTERIIIFAFSLLLSPLFETVDSDLFGLLLIFNELFELFYSFEGF